MGKMFAFSLTHTVTHTRKNVDGNNGWESVRDHGPPQQKCPESAEQWHLRGWQSVGKDEVPGSNLGSSSRKSLEPQGFGDFSFFARERFVGKFQQLFQQKRLCAGLGLQ